MRRLVRLILCLALIASTGLTSVDGAAQSRGAGGRPTLSVLFIGNSYTYVNNLGDVLAGVAAGLRGGPAIVSALAVNGGMPLGWHLENGPAMAMLAERRWDHVIIQEHSLLGGYVIDGQPRLAPPELFHSNARVLVPRIRARKAAPLFMMTWARRGQPAEEPVLTRAYLDIGRELDVPVSPVGIAFTEIQRRRIDVDLFADDGAHPSPAGSYLAACVLYVSLTGRSPKGAPASIDGSPYSRALGGIDTRRRERLIELTAAIAGQLQDVAWQVASSTPVATTR